MDLTPAQQVFSVFYAIFFGVMLQTVGDRRTPSKKSRSNARRNEVTLNLFDTPNAWAIGASFKNKPLFRTIVSIALLNILPGILFALIFSGLGSLKGGLSILQILLIVWISLIPQYIYRILYAILTIRLVRNLLFLTKSEYIGYNDHDLDAVALLETERDQFEAHRNPSNHIAFPLAVYFPSVIILYEFFFSTRTVSLRFRLRNYYLDSICGCLFLH